MDGISYPRKATENELKKLQAFGLPGGAQKVWLNMVTNSTKKTFGKRYWTWGNAFLFFVDTPRNIAKDIDIGRIDPDKEPEKKTTEETVRTTEERTRVKRELPKSTMDSEDDEPAFKKIKTTTVVGYPKKKPVIDDEEMKAFQLWKKAQEKPKETMVEGGEATTEEDTQP